MAKLTEMGTRFTLLTWPERVAFMTSYREVRQRDLDAATEFDLQKQAKSTRTREKGLKEPKERKPRAKKEPTVKINKAGLSSAELDLLRKLGAIK